LLVDWLVGDLAGWFVHAAASGTPPVCGLPAVAGSFVLLACSMFAKETTTANPPGCRSF
jgi:hypothetical protein